MEIQGFENYLIYPDGKIWNTKGNGKFLKHYKIIGGYIGVRLSNNGIVTNKRIHRLIAEHYIPNPENKPEVDHKNRIRHDNRIENLRWVTRSENEKNKGVTSSTGHKYILFRKQRKNYLVVRKINNKMVGNRQFKSKIDAICYKYILLLKIKSKVIY